jgi:phosphate transport system substrate-binding protein
VKALSIDNIQPTQENIKEDKYFLKRPYVMAIMGSIEEQNEQIQAFFDYIDSDEGQEIIKEVGLISPK